jgi:hypothetical protein
MNPDYQTKFLKNKDSRLTVSGLKTCYKVRIIRHYGIGSGQKSRTEYSVENSITHK